jgi:hypothetical protein
MLKIRLEVSTSQEFFYGVKDPNCYNADTDSSIYLKTCPHPDPDPGFQTNADPDPGQTLPAQKSF